MKNHLLFLFLCFPFLLSAQTQVAGSLPGNTTWTVAGSPYWIYSSSVRVEPGDTLTIEPGVVIKGQGTLFVDGVLLAAGTTTDPIIFTSEKDDSIGGDTNGDGNASTPQAGDWGLVSVSPLGGEAYLEHCRFYYGGKFGSGMLSIVGQGHISNCHFEAAAFRIGLSQAYFADLSIAGLSFASDVYKGVMLAAFSTAGGSYTLPELDSFPYLLGALTAGVNVTLTVPPGTVFKFLPEASAGIQAGVFNAIGTADNPIIFTSIYDDSYLGDSNQDGNATTPMPGDWGSIIIDGVIFGKAEANFSHCQFFYGGRTVNFVTLDVPGGLDFRDESKGQVLNCHFEEMGNKLGVTANFAVDLQVENLTFGPNDYQGIGLNFLFPLSKSIMDTIPKIDGLPYIISDDIRIRLNMSEVRVEPGVIFKMKPGSGINWEITTDFIAGGEKNNPIIFTSLSDDNYGGDTEQNGNLSAPAQGDWGSFRIVDFSTSQISIPGNGQFEHCLFAYGGDETGGVAAFQVEGTADLTNCTFQNFLCDVPVSKDIQAGLTIDSLSLDSSLFELIGISSDFNPSPGNVTLAPLSFPYFLNIIYVRNGLNVTIAPGTIFKGNGSFQIESGGNLELQATKEKPVVFTSVKDDLFGGDSNKDGSASTPAMMEGGGVFYSDGVSGGTLENLLFRYSNGGLVLNNSTVSLKNTTFYKNRIGIQVYDDPFSGSPMELEADSLCFFENQTGIEFYSADTFSIQHSKFEGNTQFAIRNQSTNPLFGLTPQVAHAPNNWWGDASGPAHPTDNPGGMGDSITTLVTFNPFLTTTSPSVPIAVCQDITVELDSSGMAEISLAALDAGSTDDCCLISIPDSSLTLDCSQLGQLSIPLFIYDGIGNQDSCLAQITVEDKLPPYLLCRDITLEIPEGGSESITPAQLIESGSDNCGIVNTIINQSQFDAADEGVNSVLVVVEDAAGFGTSCTALVTVTVLEDSTTLCPDSLVVDQVPAPSGNYQAADFLSSTGLINMGDSVCFTAGQEVSLLPGFEALEGSLFKAFIDSCQSAFAQEEYADLSSKSNEKRQGLSSQKQLSLECFPNPFRESISLNFFLPEPGPVEIRIFNLAGKQVFSFESLQVLPKGYYHKNLSNEIQEAGLYIVHLATGKNQLTRKVIKLR